MQLSKLSLLLCIDTECCGDYCSLLLFIVEMFIFVTNRLILYYDIPDKSLEPEY